MSRGPCASVAPLRKECAAFHVPGSLDVGVRQFLASNSSRAIRFRESHFLPSSQVFGFIRRTSSPSSVPDPAGDWRRFLLAVKREGSCLQFGDHFAVLLGEPFMQHLRKVCPLPSATGKLLVARAAFVHHPARLHTPLYRETDATGRGPPFARDRWRLPTRTLELNPKFMRWTSLPVAADERRRLRSGN